MTYLRIRYLASSGRWALERRTERKVLGFWPVYVWVLEGLYDTLKQAQDAILEKVP